MRNDVALVPAPESDIPLVQDMARFYVYDLARQVGPDPAWAVGRDWLYGFEDVSAVWAEGNLNFLIEVAGALAGFCLIDHVALVPGIGWNMGQFFVLGPWAGRGVGRAAAVQAFARCPGRWQVTQLPDNRAAIAFWRKVIDGHTAGAFEEFTAADPRYDDEPRNVMVFTQPA